MCEKTASGTVSAPADFEIQTGLAECQRSGVFINGTTGAVVVMSNGIRYAVPVGKAATIPVGRGVRVTGHGDGVVVWTVTSAALPAQLSDAPAVNDQGGGSVLLFEYQDEGAITLSSGSYNKLMFIGKPEQIVGEV